MKAAGALPIELSDAVLLTALLLMFTHFGIPLAYYCYLRNRWLRRPWGIGRDLSYKRKSKGVTLGEIRASKKVQEQRVCSGLRSN